MIRENQEQLEKERTKLESDMRRLIEENLRMVECREKLMKE
jgi:hypothetical protein